jgi:hypothetical protein
MDSDLITFSNTKRCKPCRAPSKSGGGDILALILWLAIALPSCSCPRTRPLGSLLFVYLSLGLPSGLILILCFRSFSRPCLLVILFFSQKFRLRDFRATSCVYLSFPISLLFSFPSHRDQSRTHAIRFETTNKIQI